MSDLRDEQCMCVIKLLSRDVGSYLVLGGVGCVGSLGFEG